MKLNLFLVSAVVAKNETGFTKPERKGKGNESKEANRKTCEAIFLKNNAVYGSVLDIGNSGTSGYIDIHDYPDNANCFIEVVADSNCLEITAQIIHAGLEHTIRSDCEAYTDWYSEIYEDYDACCSKDEFWFNDEEIHSCGCKGDNLEYGKGCNDHPAYDPNAFFDMSKDQQARGFHDRIFNSNSFKFNFVTDYEVAKGNVRIEWNCTKMDEVAPSAPSDPNDRLDQLVRFSVEVLDNFFADHKRLNSWKKKFARNAERMKNSYQRCGEDPVVDAEEEWGSYDESSGAKAMNDVTTGLSKWANTYISGCSGHKREKHQVKRMKKWNQKFQN